MHGITGGDWWRGAAIYELYVQSFADANGDGLGDLAGVRARLPYLAALGIDAIWFTPWYPSPKSDAGYDVADYRSIDPAFGTLADADALIADGHAHGIKTIIDIVPNHCSDRHPWFQAALAAAPGSAERARFWFRPGRGPGGDLPPNNWRSIFGGPGWTRVTAPDGTPGEWYLHLFAPEQPDFNWANPEVRAEFEAVLRFWFDRGVDGIRIWHDQALYKEAGGRPTDPHQDQPYWSIAETDTITAWIPFDGSTVANGAMAYLPGSHRIGLRTFVNIFTGPPEDTLGRDELRQIEPLTVEVPAGSVAFHHGLTFHLAAPNQTDSVRRVHTAIYFADGSTRGEGRYPHPSVERAHIAVGAVIASDFFSGFQKKFPSYALAVP